MGRSAMTKPAVGNALAFVFRGKVAQANVSCHLWAYDVSAALAPRLLQLCVSESVRRMASAAGPPARNELSQGQEWGPPRGRISCRKDRVFSSACDHPPLIWGHLHSSAKSWGTGMASPLPSRLWASSRTQRCWTTWAGRPLAGFCRVADVEELERCSACVRP